MAGKGDKKTPPRRGQELPAQPATTESKENLDRLLAENAELGSYVSRLGGRIRLAIMNHSVRVAKEFIEAGYEVCTIGNFTSACWHEGGVPTILVKNMPAEEAKRWSDAYMYVQDYDHFLGWFPGKIDREKDITRLTLDNVDEVAEKGWR